MGILKKSTSRPSRSEAKLQRSVAPLSGRPKQLMPRQSGATIRKSETKVVLDRKDGMAPFVRTAKSLQEETFDSGTVGQLAVDVFQTADEIVVIAPVAGVSIEDITIDITEGVLTIKGRRNLEFAVSPADYFTQECFWGNFSRAVILPESVDAASVTASFKDGILTVRIPKIEKIHTRMVEIREE